jgi:hypothetical protein
LGDAAQVPSGVQVYMAQSADTGEVLLSAYGVQAAPFATFPTHKPAALHVPPATQALEHADPTGLFGFCTQLPSAWQVPIEHGDIQQPQDAPTLATFLHPPLPSFTPVQHSPNTPVWSGMHSCGSGQAGSTQPPVLLHTPLPHRPMVWQFAPTLGICAQVLAASHTPARQAVLPGQLLPGTATS